MAYAFYRDGNSSFRSSVAGVFALAGALFFMAVPFSAPSLAQGTKVTLNGSVSHTTVRPGTTQTVETSRPFNDIVVGNPGVADVVPLSDTALYIQGGTPGNTNISLYDANKNLLGIIEVKVAVDFSDAAAAIRSAVPESKVQVANINERLRLTGEVRNSVDMARVVEIANQYATTENGVINALRITDPQQVNLEVRVLEATRQAGRDLGVNIRVEGGTSLVGTGAGLSVNANAAGQAQTYLTDANGRGSTLNGVPFGTAVANVLSTSGVNIDLIIDALEKKGSARRLAQPNLTAVSGETAKFNAGGEVPIPKAVQGSDGLSYDYRAFGVVLEFVPTVLDSSKINLRVKTEVSEPDWGNTVGGNPSFVTRKAESVIELRDGQSFAMAGLLKVDDARNIEQVPWLGQVPILGALFRSTSFQKKESDLVIVVTPRLVRPAEPGEKLATPLDQTVPSNDYELFALGMLEVDKNMIRKFRNGEGIIGPYGHIIDLEFDDGVVAKK